VNALTLLKELTPEWVEKRVGTSRILLPYSKEMPEGRYHLPLEDYAQNWPFKMESHFNTALDITLQRRERTTGEKYWDEDEKKLKPRKEIYYVWVQGAAFDFREGYTIERKDRELLIQIQKASPAAPAGAETKSSWETRPEDWQEMIRAEEDQGKRAVFYENPRAPEGERWKLRVMTKRNPGFARVQIYVPDNGPTIWKKDQLLDITQDQLVRMLITGERP